MGCCGELLVYEGAAKVSLLSGCTLACQQKNNRRAPMKTVMRESKNVSQVIHAIRRR